MTARIGGAATVALARRKKRSGTFADRAFRFPSLWDIRRGPSARYVESQPGHLGVVRLRTALAKQLRQEGMP